MDNNELAHYGVPGMKWGVRKAEDRTSRHQAKTKVAKSKQDYEKVQLERRKAQDAYKLNKTKEKLALTDHKLKQKMELEKIKQAKLQTKKISDDAKRIDRKEKNDAKERLAKIKQEIQTEKYLAKQEAKEAKVEAKKAAKRDMTKKVLIGVGVAAALVGGAYAVNKLKDSDIFNRGKEAAEGAMKKVGGKKTSDAGKDGFSSKIKDAFEKVMNKAKDSRTKTFKGTVEDAVRNDDGSNRQKTRPKDIYDVDFDDVTDSKTASRIAGLLDKPVSSLPALGSNSNDNTLSRVSELLKGRVLSDGVSDTPKRNSSGSTSSDVKDRMQKLYERELERSYRRNTDKYLKTMETYKRAGMTTEEAYNTYNRVHGDDTVKDALAIKKKYKKWLS